MGSLFKLHAPYHPAGSQPDAIKQLVKGRPGRSTLMGVTGSGKTFTLANVIAQHNKPTLILSPNKTLAAQLYEEFCQFFPENKVCYFVSYYDFYQPESYLPAQDLYIPKETKTNQEIERLRIEATASLMNRDDVIIIASVSCIYSLGNPDDYKKLALPLNVGDIFSRQDLIYKLIFIQYERSDTERNPGTFQVFGNIVEINLPYYKHKLRIELFGDRIDSMQWVDRMNNNVMEEVTNTIIFPAKHFVTTEDKKRAAITSIREELRDWLPQMEKDVCRDRLSRRVTYDLELLEQYGYCNGIENYSIHLDGRKKGEKPFCLFDFFGERDSAHLLQQACVFAKASPHGQDERACGEPAESIRERSERKKGGDFLLVVDESHIAIPQFRGMYSGDRSRKQTLIDFGFRLPSALDNRPLKFEEIEKYFNDIIYVSATPGEYEFSQSKQHVEQIIRPTGLVDPIIEIHKRENQIEHLLSEIKEKSSKNYRTLITVLTKRMAEELADFLENKGVKVCYLHSEIKTSERTELLQKLRLGIFDCLVGVNLLREGLDLPEVALVAIMDADIESFLRDKRSLIQTIGRAARNVDSKVIFYADKITRSMESAIDETNRRRQLQLDYNKEHKIKPQTVKREVQKSISGIQKSILEASAAHKKQKEKLKRMNQDEKLKRIIELEYEMQKAAERLDFETAIKLREEWQYLKSS